MWVLLWEELIGASVRLTQVMREKALRETETTVVLIKLRLKSVF